MNQKKAEAKNISIILLSARTIQIRRALIQICVNAESRRVILDSWTINHCFDGMPIYSSIDSKKIEIVVQCSINRLEEVVPIFNLYDDTKHYFESEFLSDLIILIKNQKLPAHKIVLALQSSVFARSLGAEINCLVIRNVDVDMMRKTLKFLYTGKLSEGDDFEVQLKLLDISDKFEIEKLKKACEISLGTCISADNVVRIAEHADLHNSLVLMSQATVWMIDNRQSLIEQDKFEQILSKCPKLTLEIDKKTAPII